MIFITRCLSCYAHDHVNFERVPNFVKQSIDKERNNSFNVYHDFVKIPGFGGFQIYYLFF